MRWPSCSWACNICSAKSTVPISRPAISRLGRCTFSEPGGAVDATAVSLRDPGRETAAPARPSPRGLGMPSSVTIIVNVSGGYSPTETDENSILVTSQKAALKNAGVEYSINPRQAGSWPGVTFTGPPLNLPAPSGM